MVRFLVGVALTLSLGPQPAGVPPLTQDQIEAFMRSAKVVATRDTSKGVTRPLRLTLSDGTLRHDAVFQAIDERKALMQSPNGVSEVNFVDSWRYNVAAYRMAGLLGLAEMMPVTIEYRFRGKTGSLAWWMESLMDEGERLKQKVEPPDRAAWNDDMFRQRVFMELVHDTDRNLTNVLVSPQWRVIMIDFSRAFRLWDTVRAAELQRIDRRLFERLEALSRIDVAGATEPHLTKGEIDAVMRRRDIIVTHYRERVKQLGEARVLY
jgi:hypothetical protein